MQNVIITLFVVSVALQYAAAFFALRLIGVTGRRLAWIMIAASISLVAIRRSILLVRVLAGSDFYPLDLTTESIALVVSLTMFAGVWLITPIFEAIKRSEAELSDRLGFLRKLVDAVPTPVYFKDADGVFLGCNRAYEQYSGRARKDIIGKTALEVERGEAAKERHLSDMELIKKGGEEASETAALYPDGSGHEFIVNKATFDNPDGSRGGVVATMFDITERKDIERQKADLYAMVTHDLKSPITAISGFAELVRDEYADKLDADLLSIAAAMQTSCAKMLGLVEDFLAISRLETGGMGLEQEDVVPEELVHEVCSAMRQSAEAAGVSLTAEVEGGLPPIEADKKKLDRALTNLVINAVSYTPAGGSVKVRAEHRGEGPDKALAISVADDGPGIPRSEQDRIFEKYYRSKKSSGVKGTGLGLAIVRAVAEAHGGSVELESEEGKGSRFTIVLPIGKKPAASR